MTPWRGGAGACGRAAHAARGAPLTADLPDLARSVQRAQGEAGVSEGSSIDRVEEATGTRGLACGSLRVHAACGSDTMRSLAVVSHARGLGLAGGCGMHGLPGCKVENIVRSRADVLAEQHWLHLLRRCTCPVAGAAEPVQLSRNGKREVGVELGHPVHCAVSGGLRGKAGPCRGRRWWGGSAAWVQPRVT